MIFKNFSHSQRNKRLLSSLLNFVLPFTVYAATDCQQVTEIPPAECHTLVELYQGTDGENWQSHLNWTLTNTPCSWEHISCENGHVIRLALWNNQLRGTIPDLSALSQLRYLSLNTNQLEGPIPNLSALSQLEVLNLAFNQLTGPIPDLSTLTQLENIRLQGNRLSGNIPNLSTLSQLKYLTLFDNQLTGQIPDLSQLVQLNTLALNNNQLTGPVPDLTALSQLKSVSLNLSDNRLDIGINCDQVKQIPKEECETLLNIYHSTNGRNWMSGYLWNFVNVPCLWRGVTCENGHVQAINLSSNWLAGVLPDLSALSFLQTLDLSHNSLRGSIPSLNTLSQLTLLSLSNNQFTGSIPDLNSLTQLKGLSLSKNQLSGQIPGFSFPQLESLNLSDNQLDGQIPELHLPQLKYLDLSNNQLSGLTEFDDLPQLELLSLFHNQLTGPIPRLDTLSQLKWVRLQNNQLTGSISDLQLPLQIYELNLENNKLTGKIPDLTPFTQLTSLNLSNNFLESSIVNCDQVTQIPKEECETLVMLYHQTDGKNWKTNGYWTLTNVPCLWKGITCKDGHVQEIFLRDNQLQGTIPDLSSLSQLRSLKLPFNQLSGSVPTLINPELQQVDLSHNQLSGSISNLMLPQLQVFDLSYNQLAGPLPDRSVLPQLEALVLSHNQLTGTIPELSSLSQLMGLLLDYNQLTGPLPDFTSLSRLRTIYVDHNRLTGTPPDLSKLPQVDQFFFSDNDFDYTNSFCSQVTEIPRVECEALLTFYQSTNGQNWWVNKDWLLTHTPCSWYGIECIGGHVVEFNLEVDNLVGSTRIDFRVFSQLQRLGLAGNQLTGPLPNLEGLSQLKEVFLSTNHFCGDIPSSLTTLTSLLYISLDSNHLTLPTDPTVIDFLDKYGTDGKTQIPSNRCPADMKFTLINAVIDHGNSVVDPRKVLLTWVPSDAQSDKSSRVWRGEPINGRCDNDPNNYLHIKLVASAIQSPGTSIAEAIYTYLDADVEDGTTYCYALEEIDQQGQSVFHLENMASVKTK